LIQLEFNAFVYISGHGTGCIRFGVGGVKCTDRNFVINFANLRQFKPEEQAHKSVKLRNYFQILDASKQK